MRATHLIAAAMFVMASFKAYALDLNAKAYYIGHPDTGTQVLANNENVPMGPASLTKLMTLHLLFGELKNGSLTLQSELPISKKAWKKGGSKMFLEVGKTAKVEDLIKGIAVSSGNDACIVVAEYLGGTEDGFASMMNAKASEIGMINTTFKNATGWPDPEQVTTARDMFLLASSLVKNYPEYYDYFKIKEFEYSGIKQPNRNGLLKRQGLGVDGLKTGHTEEAGYHLVASALKDGTRLISVVLGTSSFGQREGESAKGLVYGQRNFSFVQAVEKGATVEEAAPVWLGKQESTRLVAAANAEIFLNRKDQKNIGVKVMYPSPIEAPINAGDKVGQVEITNPTTGEKTYVDLLAASDVEELGFFGKLLAHAKLQLGLN